MGENYITKYEDKGSINISEDVIAVMITAALAEVDGVAGLANTVGGEIADLLGKKSVSKGVKVRFEEDKVIADVIATVRFGSNITTVAKKIQAAVSSALDSMTGLESVVNVHISGVAFDKN